MCGIYGMVTTRGSVLRYPEALEAMGKSQRHRGPDGRAVFTDRRAAFGTERLRIVDLEERADQPFASPDGAVWLCANGEIYNSPEIRARYPDYPFRSHSDVETILPLYLEHGARAIEMLDGMFGLAILDSRDGSLILARDRAGEKPLFYARAGNEILFASELQGLTVHPEVSLELDPAALSDYLELGYVLEPRTPFVAVRKVPAGTILRFREDGSEEAIRYWDPASFEPSPIAPEEAIHELRRRIERAVTKQVMSDVPIGVFVSGGLDSSILATLASRAIGVDRVWTFAAQFAEASYDESQDAARLAARMRTRHRSVRIDEETLRDALDHVVQGVAEPIADPAILPTYLLARAAREHVKVVLSGEGADELFGGYPTHLGHKIAPAYAAIPGFVRGTLGALVRALPSSGKKVPLEYLLKSFVAHADRPWLERHLAWFGTGLPEGARALPGHGMTDLLRAPAPDPIAGAMLLDYRTYLRDNLLVKVDRATMLSSVEARAPFLDRDVTALALSLPTSLRIRGFTTKWVLKKAAEEWLPKDVIYRRKRGLSVPIATWINHGLSAEVDRLLEPGRLRRQGIVNERVVGELLAQHRSGRANHAKPLWTVIVLQYWMERFVEQQRRAPSEARRALHAGLANH